MSIKYLFTGWIFNSGKRTKFESELKTINNNSIIGSGNLTVGGGSFSGTMDDIPDGTNYVKSENNLSDTLKGIYDGYGTSISGKVDKVTGKELSTNDLTDILKGLYDAAVLAAHAHSNKTILDNIEQSFTSALKTAYDGAVTDKHTHTNKATLDLIQEALTTALKATYDGYSGQISGKQATLVNQTNIKSINGTTLLGSGDLVVSANPYLTNVLSADLTIPANNSMGIVETYEIGDTFTLELANTSYMQIN